MNIKNNLKNSPKQYKAFSFLCMLYITIAILANILIYKLTHIGPFIVSVGTFIIPLWYVLGDIIAEVYGYQVTRRLIWQTLICTLIFSIAGNLLIYLPNPPGMGSNQMAYTQILGHLIRIFFGMLLAVLVGSFLNAFALTKWKIFLQGKFYWLRSMGSSAMGQFCFTFISISFDLFHVLSLHNLLQLIVLSFIIKLIITPLAITPATIIAFYLKKYEGIDIYDNYTDFNPFRLKESTVKENFEHSKIINS